MMLKEFKIDPSKYFIKKHNLTEMICIPKIIILIFTKEFEYSLIHSSRPSSYCVIQLKLVQDTKQYQTRIFPCHLLC